MRLAIEHVTEYVYSAPAAYAVQYARLSPRNDISVQKVLSWSVKGPGNSAPWQDGLGNPVLTVVQQGHHDRLLLRVQGEVETFETHGVVPFDAAGVPAEAFIRPTRFTQMDERLRDFAGGFERQRQKGALSALHALMAEISDRVAYVPDTTHAHSTAAAALAQGSGICQDHAHIFIACCRAWGVPARYVSGYLYTNAQDGRQLETHGWAEALVEYLGWVSFDPSNCQSATPAYVRLAVGFDYDSAAPVRGVRGGGGDEALTVRVKVNARPDQ
jgi:transglutaminase-like putative cysteine protease